jgi:multidrug/hemolysin transport system ATP-binding protein
MSAIEVKNLKKSYGDIKALKGVSFKIKKGAFSVILGKNGAGKSTLIEIITMLKNQDSGQVFINSKKAKQSEPSLRNSLGIVFQKSTLDNILTVKENLMLRSGLYNIGKQEFEKQINYLDQKLNFKSFYNQKVATLSGGQRRKVDILRALLHKPEILILDEPTTGLDAQSRKQIWSVIMELQKQEGITVILTTHYLEETNDADQAIIIDKGILLEDETPANLKSKYLKSHLKVWAKNEQNFLKKLKQDEVNFNIKNNYILLNVNTSFNAVDLVNTYKKYIKDFEILKSTMDEVFLNLTVN